MVRTDEEPNAGKSWTDADVAMLRRLADERMATRRIAERLETDNVARARLSGWTWEEIGDALGVTRQAAHKKHGRL